jgi:hypothetical protein
VELRYLYVGSADTERDVCTWLSLPGARMRWRFRHLGADVAAIDLGSPPVLLIADHRPPGSILPIYAVDDFDAARADSSGQGWSFDVGPMQTPEGPACVLRDRSGCAIAFLRLDRPGVMDAAYVDEGNPHAVRGPTG